MNPEHLHKGLIVGLTDVSVCLLEPTVKGWLCCVVKSTGAFYPVGDYNIEVPDDTLSKGVVMEARQCLPPRQTGS